MKKKLIIAIISIVTILIGAFYGFNTLKQNEQGNEQQLTDQDNKEDEKNEAKIEETDELYVIYSSEPKKEVSSLAGTEIMNTYLDLDSTEIIGYNNIKRCKIKYCYGDSLYTLNLPIINDMTYSTNIYTSNRVNMKSDYMEIEYNIGYKSDTELHNLESNFMNSYNYETKNLNVISEDRQKMIDLFNSSYSDKISEIVEENGVRAFATSTKYTSKYSSLTTYSLQFIKELDNRMVDEITYWGGDLKLMDDENYDKWIQVLRELGNSMNYDLVKLIEDVKQ